MQKLINYMTKMVNESNDPQEMSQKLTSFANSDKLSQSSASIAKSMVTMISKEKQVNWKIAAKKSSMGKYIYKALKRITKKDYGSSYKDIIENNATLIRTLPQDLAKQMTEKIAKLSVEGVRASEIAKIIKKDFPKNSRAKASLIARTEVSKASTALTQVQSLNMGINWYVWRTSEDIRVRSSHDHMEDVLVCWTDPPSPEPLVNEPNAGRYHAGNIYNCRCYPEPLVDLSLISWPHKVYHNGKIQMLTRVKFEAIM